MPPLLTFGHGHGDSEPGTIAGTSSSSSSSTSYSGFTSALMDTILDSKIKMQQWVEFEKAKTDRAVESYRLKLLEEQAAIDAQIENLHSVQMERGYNVDNNGDDDNTSDGRNEENNNNKNNASDAQNSDSIAQQKKELENQRAVLELEILKLKEEYENREQRVSDTALEECKQRARAEEARALKERVREAKQMTIDDLTRGIVNYKYLGLDFEKTKVENELRFYFSRLDPTDPDKKFSFKLQVNDDDKYELADCEPPVDAVTLFDITERLNKSDDMSYLVRKMRRAFAETIF